MRKILIALFFFMAASSNAQKVIYDRDAELREVSDFNSIEVSAGSMELHLSPGKENVVAVSAPGEKNRNAITTEVSNGVLKVAYGGRKLFGGGSSKVKVYIAVKSLKKLTVSGTSDVVVTGVLEGNELSVELNGASDFKGAVNAGSLRIDLSGASDAEINGTATNLNVKASGASHLKGYGLDCNNCRVEGSGASKIKLTVNTVINVDASGATSVDFKGSGKTGTIQTSGASSVNRKE